MNFMFSRLYIQKNQVLTAGILFLMLVMLPGCISFPVGSNIVSERDAQVRTISSKRTPLSCQATEFSTKAADSKNVYVSTISEINDVEEKVVIEHTVVSNDEIFLIGLFPGICTHWAIWERANKSVDGSFVPDLSLCAATAILTGLTGGIPMLISWFSEGSSEWEPAEMGGKIYESRLICL